MDRRRHDPYASLRAQARVEGENVVSIEAMIAEMQKNISDLDDLIVGEEERSQNSDPDSFNYPTCAQAWRTRRSNCESTLSELKRKLEVARTRWGESQNRLDTVIQARNRFQRSKQAS